MNMEQLETAIANAPIVDVVNGFATIDRREFYSPRLKGHSQIAAFVSEVETWPDGYSRLAAFCYTEHGVFALAHERDSMGVKMTRIPPQRKRWG